MKVYILAHWLARASINVRTNPWEFRWDLRLRTKRLDWMMTSRDIGV